MRTAFPAARPAAPASATHPASAARLASEARPDSAPARFDSQFGINREKPGPLDRERENANAEALQTNFNAAALQANFDSALKSNQTPSI